MHYNNNNYSQSNFSQREFQLSNTLRRLWLEHVMWTRFFIVSSAFNLPDLDAVTNRLLQNPSDFAAVLKTLYGDYKSMVFDKIFTDHLLIAAQLVNAAKAGNTKLVNEKRDQWYANATDIATLLAEINPHWNKTNWQNMLFDHLEMTENEAVQMLTGKYNESIAQYDAIQAQALEMADEMANGIFEQFGI